MLHWLNDIYTKVCVYVNSEQELLDIYNKAKEANIPCSLIQDCGLTEFGGVPTYTCVAVGPDWNDKINEITGHLPLL
jgi:PTH2 family peptidyl-tRNA hydrolase